MACYDRPPLLKGHSSIAQWLSVEPYAQVYQQLKNHLPHLTEEHILSLMKGQHSDFLYWVDKQLFLNTLFRFKHKNYQVVGVKTVDYSRKERVPSILERYLGLDEGALVVSMEAGDLFQAVIPAKYRVVEEEDYLKATICAILKYLPDHCFYVPIGYNPYQLMRGLVVKELLPERRPYFWNESLQTVAQTVKALA